MSENEKKEVVNQEENVINDKYISLTDGISLEKAIEEVNKNETGFINYRTKETRKSVILFFVLVALCIGTYLLSSVHQAFLWVTLALLVVGVVLLPNIIKKSKKGIEEAGTKVMTEYFYYIDSAVLHDESFKEVKYNFNDKMPMETFQDLRIIKDINSTGGRCVTIGKFLDYDFKAGDYLVKTLETISTGDKQQYIVFLGKLFVFEIPNLCSEGRMVIYLKGKGANGPTDIEDLKKVEGILPSKYDLYSSCKVSEVLSERIVAILDQYVTTESLIDMFITVDQYRVSFGFSYADSIMTLPLINPIDEEGAKQYYNDVEKMVKILKVLVK